MSFVKATVAAIAVAAVSATSAQHVIKFISQVHQQYFHMLQSLQKHSARTLTSQHQSLKAVALVQAASVCVKVLV